MSDAIRDNFDASDAPAPEASSVTLDQALRNNWLEIWYQPKIDLRRKCLAGAEALVRIRHPREGVSWPKSFLPDADEASMARLTEYMLQSAAQDWATFNSAGFNLHLAINVPVDMLSKLPIAEIVARHRPQSDAWPGMIMEVAEDQIARDIAFAKRVASELRICGVSISIDDFGSGFTSFASLRDLPFAELKLDGSFVNNCATDATSAAICQTAIDLAHRFGSAVVAEGIEQITDLQALMVMGCDFGQGMLLAPPMTKDRFLELLRQRMNRPTQTERAPSAVEAGGRVA